jgi:hypothetical protein
MAELTQADVYSPRSLQVWRTLLNWLAFFFQIFYQILRALGHQPMLSSASSSSSPSFKPLPVVELPDHDSPPTSAVEIPAAAPDSDFDDRSEKLTVRPPHNSSIFGKSSKFFLLSSLNLIQLLEFFFCYFSFTFSMFTSLVQLDDWIYINSSLGDFR